MSHYFRTTQYETWHMKVYRNCIYFTLFWYCTYISRNVFCSYEKIDFVQNIYLYFWHLYIERENRNYPKISRSIVIFCRFYLLNSEIGCLIFEELPISRRFVPTIYNIIMKKEKPVGLCNVSSRSRRKAKLINQIFSLLAFIQGSIIASNSLISTFLM